MHILSVAWRNLTRNRRRAALALLTVSFGVIAMVLADGFVQWIFWAMRESAIQSRLGHVQIAEKGYFRDGLADQWAYLLPEHPDRIASLEGVPGVKLVTPRLLFSGLVSHGETSVSFLGEGVVPAKETELNKHLHVVKGHDLESADARQVLLGRGLARNLDVVPGDSVVLMANTASGGINAVELTVAGLFITASEAFDQSALRIPMDIASELVRAKGAHVWVVLLESTELTDALLPVIRARFNTRGEEFDVVPWTELADFYNKTVQLFSRQMDVVRLVIGLIIVFSISNMLVMGVLERTAEIGTLMALGYRKKRILQLFVTESLLLGCAGGALGVLLGVGLALVVSWVGIPMPPPPGMEIGFTAEIRLTWELVLKGFVVAIVTTALAGLYPAWKASRLEVVNALRHSR